MRAPLPIPAVTAICALCWLAAPIQGAPTAKRKPRRATAQVTAAMRAAALKRVNQNLAASANLTLRQPGALAPVFEQLLRLTSGQSRDPVHILHFGDSHTAADQWTGGLRDSSNSASAMAVPASPWPDIHSRATGASTRAAAPPPAGKAKDCAKPMATATTAWAASASSLGVPASRSPSMPIATASRSITCNSRRWRRGSV